MKRRKCWFPAFYPFHTMFSKVISLGSSKVRIMSGLCGKELKGFAKSPTHIWATDRLTLGLTIGALKTILHVYCHRNTIIIRDALNTHSSKSWCITLYLSGTNFRLVSIQSLCRIQHKCCLKIEICFWVNRKHHGKRRKSSDWLPAFSPTPNMFSHGFFLRDCLVMS